MPGQLPIAADISVYIPDMQYGVSRSSSNYSLVQDSEKVDPNCESKSDSNCESKPDSNCESKPDSNCEPKTASKCKSKPDSNGGSQTDSNCGSPTDSNCEPKPDSNGEPRSDYPGIKAEPLPKRRSNLALQAVQESLWKFRIKHYGKSNSTAEQNLIVQVVGRSDSLDLRDYDTCGPASGLFLNTVHECFSKHMPLGIRPECLMYMVLHEVGVTVKENPKVYRHLFTDSPTKKLINVNVIGLDIHRFDQTEVWAQGIELLHTGLSELMPAGLIEHLMPSISTHDLDSLTASMVAVLDAASPYYDYAMCSLCGIPAIRLFGTAQDYDNIVAACRKLSDLFAKHLGLYFTHLLPVLQEIADTAAGRKQPDNDFWSSIYKHYSGSGTDDMDGWITTFVNYCVIDGKYVPKDEQLYDWQENLKRSWNWGINRERIPDHISLVPFIWNYNKNHAGDTEGEFAGCNFGLLNGGTGAKFDCRLVGGFLGVDDMDGYATPALSYAVIRGKDTTGKSLAASFGGQVARACQCLFNCCHHSGFESKFEADGTWTTQVDGQDAIEADQV